MKKVSSDTVAGTPFPVVGIGASAGGLDAVRAFLRALPAKTGMAFVFIQHLSPDHQSILPDILQKVSPFPVQLITDNIHLDPDNLYIIPQNKIVTTTDGILKLAPLNKKNKKSNTIDLFFSSLGVVHQSYAVGVILSGALNDGTLGLQVIKSYGGLTFAQDEDSAAFDSMPRSAVNSGAVDFVLPPEKIAEHLMKINSPFHTNYSAGEVKNTLPQQDNDVFKQILTVLRVRRGVDFTYYKQSTLKRRIIRRMALNRLEKPLEYLGFLRENKIEQDALYNDMLISVTNFFRDQQSFDMLCTEIFPALINRKEYGEALRIWIAGCATGEEAYSMAMCLQEQLGDKATTLKIQIFATDISETAIAKARTGVYSQTELEGVSSSRLAQFFIKQDANHQVAKSIRDMCVFAHHNLLKDPPFSKIDMVSCRNVMIYFEPVLQKKALTTFNYSLNQGGYLLLGKSETIGSNTDMFTPYNRTEKIYHRNGPLGRFMTANSPGREQTFKDIDKSTQKLNDGKDIYTLADQAMLANFMPASVLVNDKFEVIQFRGVTENWLVQPTGKPSFNVLKMAREGLSFELRNMLHLAQKTAVPVRKFGVFFFINELQHFVNIQVLRIPDALELHFLIVFYPVSATGLHLAMPESEQPGDKMDSNGSELRIGHLERELMQTRADMRIISEEQESANEELQSANEEILSGSEELQSLNEELETSKEELQSTNEEIMIVNKELLDRNEQLNNTRLYAEGIVSTIRDPLIILDKDLRVKRATGGFYKKFNITEKETEGFHFYELLDRQWDNGQVRKLLEGVLPAKKEQADIEVTQIYKGLGKRIMCMNAREIDNINGEKLILLAIEDITDKRTVQEGLAEAERLLSESKERLKFAVDSAGLGTWDYDPQTKNLVWDKRCKEIFGLKPMIKADLLDCFEMIHPVDRPGVEDNIRHTITKKGLGEFDIEFRSVAIKDATKWLKAKGRAYFNEGGIPMRFIGTLLDVTGQKIIDDATRDLLNKKDEFISIASHELKTPITSLKMALQMVERTIGEQDDLKQAHAFVKKGIKQVDKLVELIADLLEVTKIQAGKLALRKTNFVLSELIDECCEEMQAISQKHRLHIEGETDFKINADRNRLEQVLVNLISNAVKYAPDSDKIIVNISRADGLVKIAITDFGIGIPHDKIEFLFDRFYRVNESSQKYAGLGLGLYISSEIVKRHGGHINIESEEGKGSTFWFTIPI